MSRMTVWTPSEALGNNSRTLLALRDALRRGEIRRVLQGPVRAHVTGARSFRQMTPALLELVISDYRSGLSVYVIAGVRPASKARERAIWLHAAKHIRPQQHSVAERETHSRTFSEQINRP